MQILFLNLVTDVFPAFALGMGEGEKDDAAAPATQSAGTAARQGAMVVYRRAGRPAHLLHLGALVLGRYWLGLEGEALVTLSFLTLAFGQLWHVFNMRDTRAGLFRNKVTRNTYVWGALALCIAILRGGGLPAGAGRACSIGPPEPDGLGHGPRP